MNNRLPSWAVWTLVATALFGLVGGFFRIRAESRNRAVALAIEADLIQAYASADGVSFGQAVKTLKAKGLGAVVFQEETVGEWIGSDQLGFDAGGNIVCWPGAEARIARAVKVRYPNSPARPVRPGVVKAPGVPTSVLRGLSLGLDAKKAKAVWSQGLEVVFRGANPPGADGRVVTETLKWARESGAKVFMPLGERVLGHRNAVKDLVAALESTKMVFASPEFAKIAGDSAVVAAAPGRIVRLHAAQAVEIDKMTERAVIERYARAASERGIRILLLRPLSEAGPESLGALGALVEKTGRALRSEGLQRGEPHPFEDIPVPNWLFALTGMAAASVVSAALHGFFGNRRIWLVGSFLIGLMGLACWMPGMRQPVALMAAFCAPLVGFLLLDRFEEAGIFKRYALVSAASLAGGLAVVGLLNGLPYIVRAEQFMGVKLAHFGPIVVVGIWFFSKFCDIRGSLEKSVVWMQAVLALAVVGALAFMLMRTGNDNPASVSGLELRIRSLLDQILLVRPRTKELLGHPALVVGLALWAKERLGGGRELRYGGWIALALMLGAIGQTSIVNTMCHIHTPLLVGLARVLVGWLVGGLIGFFAWSLISPRIPLPEPVIEPEEESPVEANDG